MRQFGRDLRCQHVVAEECIDAAVQTARWIPEITVDEPEVDLIPRKTAERRDICVRVVRHRLESRVLGHPRVVKGTDKAALPRQIRRQRCADAMGFIAGRCRYLGKWTLVMRRRSRTRGGARGSSTKWVLDGVICDMVVVERPGIRDFECEFFTPRRNAGIFAVGPEILRSIVHRGRNLNSR